MRICIPIHSFEPGGVERVGLRLAGHWQAAGHEVTVVLGRDRGPTRDQMRAETPGLTYVTRPEPFSTAAWETPWLVWCLWRYLRRERPDVIFCAGNTYTIVCVMIKLMLGRSCPPVLVKISNDLERNDASAAFRVLYHAWLRVQGRMLQNFVAMGPGAQAEIARLISNAATITFIPNPILGDGEATQRNPGGPRDASRFVAIGRLESQKNLPLLIDAFADARRVGDTLTIFGEGRQRARLERQIAALGLSDSVVLAGHRADAPALIDRYDVLVVSSNYEGLGSVIIEALARGVPVISTDCSSTTRHLLGLSGLGPAPHGWLVAVRDRAGLAKAMREIDLSAFDSQSAYRLARQFSLSEASTRYLDLFRALISDQTKRNGA